MLLLYTSGKIKATEKFKSVTLALLLSTISISILAFIGYLITATRGYVMIFAGNPIFDIAMSVIFIGSILNVGVRKEPTNKFKNFQKK